MFQMKSLRQKVAISMLLPVAILLIFMGYTGFVFARKSVLAQWREAAILKLQRAAHGVDMRLNNIQEWVRIFNNTAGDPLSVSLQTSIVEQIKKIEGVVQVNLDRYDSKTDAIVADQQFRHMSTESMDAGLIHSGMMMPFHHGNIAMIAPPHYDEQRKQETVSLVSDLTDRSGGSLGRLEVVVRFDYLIENVKTAGWWQSHKAYLLDRDGRILTATLQTDRHFFGRNGDPLEKATLRAMNQRTDGTLLGEQYFASEVSGFYRLQTAPWTLVIIAPARAIMAPVVRLRLYFLISGAAFIFFVLFLIRLATGRTVSSIRAVSKAADKLARGEYKQQLVPSTKDEVGELICSFNAMAGQLEERWQLRKAMDLAMHVQHSLLPRKPLAFADIDIAGRSIYCEETGGDYYDFLLFPELGRDRVGVVVGDVAGHGIAAALLMTTVRALIRSRSIQPGNLSEIITDVNRLLCIDTVKEGNFMTLFFMLLDPLNQELLWVRAGHDPALVYDPETDDFQELAGHGIALGAEETWQYRQNRFHPWKNGQVILIGTDGIWETVNPEGAPFGKDRLKRIVRRSCDKPAQAIIQDITDALNEYRGAAEQSDDITAVVIKKQI